MCSNDATIYKTRQTHSIYRHFQLIFMMHIYFLNRFNLFEIDFNKLDQFYKNFETFIIDYHFLYLNTTLSELILMSK